MKLAIHQPYLFPYLGYFQLINSVDYFGIADDFQYIKHGWINRNRLLTNNAAHLFTFSVKKARFTNKIRDRVYCDKFEFEKMKFKKTLVQYYEKSPFFEKTSDLINEILEFDSVNISDFNSYQLKKICNYLDIETKFLPSSKWEGLFESSDCKEVNLIHKIKSLSYLGIDTYINALGGKSIYSKETFKGQGIELRFLKSNPTVYEQFFGEFVPNLSIIDVLMFNSIDKVKEYLNDYKLL